MPQQAVIFDADGVLVDSYQPHLESWRDLAADVGRTLTLDQFHATFGRTSREIIQLYWPPEGLTDERIAAIDARKEAIYRQRIAARFPVMDGAPALIDELLATGFALGVGTSGPPENLALLLQEMDGPRWCSAAISAADIRRGKPDPEVFLLCAERLGVPPQRCAVVEDAQAGIAAARAAGMLAIGFVSHGHTREELSAADHMVNSLHELTAERIAAWLASRRSG